MLRFIQYIDASGSEGDLPENFLTVAAVMARDELWRLIAAEWEVLLKCYGIKTFSMSACMKGAGEFAPFAPKTRLHLINDLADMLVKHSVACASVSMSLGDYAQANRDFKIKERYGGPYCVCALFLLSRIEAWYAEGWESGGKPDMKLLTLIEAGDAGQGSLRGMIELFKRARPNTNPRFSRKTVRDGAGVITRYVRPFEAADFMAFAIRRRAARPTTLLAKPLWPIVQRALKHNVLLAEDDLREMAETLKVERRVPDAQQPEGKLAQ